MNYFSSRRNQLYLEKYIKNAENLSNNYINTKKATIYGEKENNAIYPQEESKYNVKQILKNYHLNRASNKYGFTRKYISLLTDLLYENNSKDYSLKRLSLVNFRKNIIRKNIALSFENFVKKESSLERSKKLNTIVNNICITNINKKLFSLNYKNKTDYYFKNKTNFNQFKTEKSSINISKKYNLKLNLEGETYVRYKDKEKNNIKSFPEINFQVNISPINKKTQLKTILPYMSKKIDEPKKYMWNINPTDELLKKNNKIKFIDYLKKKYNFYRHKSYKEIKNIKEIYKRQVLFNKEGTEISTKVEFPFQKEFFTRLNRLNLKRIKICDIKN